MHAYVHVAMLSALLWAERPEKQFFSHPEEEQQKPGSDVRGRTHRLLSDALKRVMRQRQRTESESDFKVRVGIDGSADGICTPGWIDNYTPAEIEMGLGKCLACFCSETQMQILV